MHLRYASEEMRPPTPNMREAQTVVAGEGEGVQSARGGGGDRISLEVEDALAVRLPLQLVCLLPRVGFARQNKCV